MNVFVSKRLLLGLTLSLTGWFGLPRAHAVARDTILLGEENYHYEKVKTISRSYSVTSQDILAVKNSFGRIDVSTWAKSQFEVVITMKAKANSEQSAEETLNRIHIRESRSGKEYSFITELDRMRRNNGWGLFGSSAPSFEINYVIHIPNSNAVDLVNKYGNTKLPDLGGSVHYDGSYGNLVAGNLVNDQNELRVRYGNADIESLTQASLNFAYGNLQVRKSKDLTLRHEYGNLTLGSVSKLHADMSYCGVSIDRLLNAATLKLRYSGSCKFGSIDPGVKLIDIDAEYSDVELPLESGADFSFSVSVHYGNFKYDKASTRFTHNSNDLFEGHVGGSDGTSGKIVISSNYGSVRFR